MKKLSLRKAKLNFFAPYVLDIWLLPNDTLQTGN